MPRLTYVKDAYGSRYRVDLDELESGKVLLHRFNNKGEKVLDKDFRPSRLRRENVVGPWPNCIHGLEAYQKELDATFA